MKLMVKVDKFCSLALPLIGWFLCSGLNCCSLFPELPSDHVYLLKVLPHTLQTGRSGSFRILTYHVKDLTIH